jgi:hypothetical protein
MLSFKACKQGLAQRQMQMQAQILISTMENQLKKLHLRPLLDFYDYRVASANTHASAINAVLGEDIAIALMCHYFSAQGSTAEALPTPCTTGKQKGYRLDKWIAVKSIDQPAIIYQVEIKNWSAHSIGGTTVKRDATIDEMSDYRSDRWHRQFKTESDTHLPSQKETLKVLTKMLLPQSHQGYEHKALLCFWEALHPEGKDEPLFSVDVPSNNFEKLEVFSMSNYIRRLLEHTDTLEVEMRDTDARIAWLSRIYSD